MSLPYFKLKSGRTYTAISNADHESAIIIVESTKGTFDQTVQVDLQVWNSIEDREAVQAGERIFPLLFTQTLLISGSEFTTYFNTVSTFTSKTAVQVIIEAVFAYILSQQPIIETVNWDDWEIQT